MYRYFLRTKNDILDLMNDNNKSFYIDVESFAQTHIAQKKYSYKLTEGMNVKKGSIVIVPFGKKEVLAVVLKIYESAPKIKNIRTVTKVLEDIVLPDYLAELAQWMQEYYIASPKSVWSTLLPSGLANKSRIKLDETKTKTLLAPNKLNPEQKKALSVIKKNKTTLLFGITGSGKTEVYLNAIKKYVEDSKSVIVLVPEIMLTTQIYSRLGEHFANVFVWHSSLSVATRKKIWLKVLSLTKQKKPVVVLGARSSLFLPLTNLGLIIIDEEHEPSYKQEQSPRYEAQIVAAKIAELKNSKLILGSATPSLRSYYLAKIGKIGFATISTRHNSKLPDIKIYKKEDNKQIIQSELKKAIDKNLNQKKQTMLFLNRRGSAQALICNNCGNISSCPNCMVSLRYHNDIGRLVCHYCNYSRVPESVCSNCDSLELRYIGDGTKKLEQEIISNWPKARVARVDRDNSKLPYLIKTFHQLRNGEIDIIVGTQMISRGLDIENLSLVGIVDADSMLSVSDFTSRERTFQLISQVAGRAGRREEVGQVIIQTNNNKSDVIVNAANHDYQSFYNTESSSRTKYAYPPYFFLLKLQYEHKNESTAKLNAVKMTSKLRGNKNIKVLGPVKYYKRTLAKKTVYQIIVKSKSRKVLQQIAHSLPQHWQFDLDPITIL